MATQTFLATLTTTSVENITLTSTVLPSDSTDFIGWWISDGTVTSSFTCDGSWSLYAENTNAACCNPSSTCDQYLYTACVGNVALGPAGSTTCSSSFPDCSAVTVYSQFPATESGSVLYVDCYNEIGTAGTAYQTVIQMSYADITMTVETTSTSYSTLPSPTTTTPPSSASITSSSTTPMIQSSGAVRNHSHAWIAGAVVGPVVGVAMIALGVFFFLRRKQLRQQSPDPFDSPHTQSPEMTPKGPAVPYMDDPMELAHDEAPRAELESPEMR